jgi:hypothetical protein
VLTDFFGLLFRCFGSSPVSLHLDSVITFVFVLRARERERERERERISFFLSCSEFEVGKFLLFTLPIGNSVLK